MKEKNTNKSNIEKLLADGNAVQLHPQGYSMYPMFLPERDEAIIAPIEDISALKRGDVVLYRRDMGILVLHRICRVKKDGFYLVGDNQTEVEGPLRPEQIKGVLTAFIRNGRKISCDNPIYRLASGLWLFLRPVRRCIALPVSKLRKLFKRRLKRRSLNRDD